ncbi:MerR family transcriptional regulator [Paenibacillus antibioticophila]|uniref:MerR family transcriptional regulator n=1 Tax=Paenibacillus antibioticophila TaxID=1274374 RepID=UPI0005C83C16|nr:MerR family transcriptional regulator [Paenibacillus antibioticophila]
MVQWTTGQVAKKRSISVRTLRFYDQIGLLRPGRKDDHGRRYYSEDDLFRLEKIMMLKQLALPLEDIAHLLDALSYREILIAHHNHLQDQLSALQKQIDHTVSLIHMVDLEDDLPWEKVSGFIAHGKSTPKKWVDYFEKEEQELLRRTLPKLENNDTVTQQYISLLRRIDWCISQGIQPQSEEGQIIAQELLTLSKVTFGGDQELESKFWEVRKRPAADTGLLPISEEVLAFVEESIHFAEQH